ncbi:MAG: hypothetical protein R3301_16075 [Saprospiraceae bacterium]|nr:hypothetical protein [Saprospiraceae bacterium]
MRRKYKMTGCARFFIAMIILAPLAYLGAAYYNGEDGIENIKNFLGIGAESGNIDDATYTGTEEDLQKQLRDQKRTIDRLTRENEDLRERLEEAEQELESLRGENGQE